MLASSRPHSIAGRVCGLVLVPAALGATPSRTTHAVSHGPYTTPTVHRVRLRNIRLPGSAERYEISIVVVRRDEPSDGGAAPEGYASATLKVGSKTVRTTSFGREFNRGLKEAWFARVAHANKCFLAISWGGGQRPFTDVYAVTAKGIDAKPVLEEVLCGDAGRLDEGIVVEHIPAKYLVERSKIHPPWDWRYMVWRYDTRAGRFKHGPYKVERSS